tara:strand:+ start:285 stop:770 length:486 start_codon:yes stop_codon:yes gene_type:complete
MSNENTHRSSVIQPGETAPDFTLSTKDREDWSLADAVKKSDVVLCFFPFAFTGVCGTEMECLSKEMKRWTDAGAAAVGISCDSFAALNAWAERDGYTNTMLSDIHRAACKAYGLYWSELNVAQRGTIVIGQSDDGVGTVKWSQAREPGEAMDLDQVLAAMV